MRRTAVFLLLALLSLVPGSSAEAADVHVVRAEHAGTARPVKPLDAEPTGAVREVPIRRPKPRVPDNDAEVARTSPTQQAAATKTPVEAVDVIGSRFTGVVPPDAAGEAGHTQYVHTFNTAKGAGVAVFDKTGNSLGSFRMSSLAPVGDDCHAALGDGVPLYDEINQQWILTELSASITAVCVYVSTTSDALGTYEEYIFEFNVFPDYPKWGLAGDALYLGFNNSGFSDPVIAMNYAKMRLGASLDPEDVNVENPDALPGFGFQLLTPVDVDGTTPYTGPGIFVRHRDDEVHDPLLADGTKDFIDYVEMTPDFVTGTATVDGPNSAEVSEFDSRLCGLFSINCVPQRGTRRRLDPLREVIMNRPELRIIGTDQVLVGSFAVDVGTNRAGVRWFEFHRPTAAPTTWTVHEGTLDGVGRHRWIPSIAINDAGDVALGFSESGKRVFPSMRVTGRLAGDPDGTMPQAETTLASSKAAQTIASRWGDYSEMSVDPADPDVFWYTNQTVDRRGRWMTRIGSFTLGP